MSNTDLLLFVHVSAVVVWLGGGVMFQVLARRTTRNADAEAVARVAEQTNWVGRFYFTPAAVVTLLAGLGLVLESGIGFDHLWVLIGLTAVVVSAVLGMAFFGPQSRSLAEEVRARGLDDGVGARLRRIVLVSQIELVILFVAVFAMTVKPEL